MSNEKLNDVDHGISNVDLVQIWLLSSDFTLGKFFKYSLIFGQSQNYKVYTRTIHL